MSHIPPNCDAACKAKIILNGGRVRAETRNAQDIINHMKASEAEAYQLIAILDRTEDELIEWNNRMLAKTGYKRRTPKTPSLPEV